jgi:hypothetical protein
VQQGLALLPAHVGVRIAEDKPDRSEEITLARTIAPDDDIGAWRKWFYDGLILVAVRRGVSGLEIQRFRRVSAYLLKPWMMICLICIFALAPSIRQLSQTPTKKAL